MTATRITVDNVTYRVLVEFDSLKRSFDLMEGDNAGTAVSGRTIRDILGTNYTYSMTVLADPNYPEDYKHLYWKVTEPVDYHTFKIPYGDFAPIASSLWEKGNISYSAGSNSSNSSTTIIRTISYLDSSIKQVSTIADYKIAVSVYDSSNVYQGRWNGSTVAKTNTWCLNSVTFADIPNSSSYKYRLCFTRVDGSTIAIANSVNVLANIEGAAFQAKILSGNDIYKGYYMNSKYWDKLELTFEPMEPQRK